MTELESEEIGKKIERGDGQRYVIPDIHGCCKTLDTVINQIGLSKNDQLFFLGDFIDRGPDSSGVIDYILSLIKDGYQILPLRGNHEQMLLDMVKYTPDQLSNHCQYYRIEDLLKENKVIPKYFEFFNTLPFYYELDKFFLVHAGLNLEIPNPLQDLESMLWIRNFPIVMKRLRGKKIIHGHNPTSIFEIKQSINKRKTVIPLDNGCVLSDQVVGMGNLLCLNIDSWDLIIQKNVEI